MDPTEAAMEFSEDPPQSKEGILQGLGDLEKVYRESLGKPGELSPPPAVARLARKSAR